MSINVSNSIFRKPANVEAIVSGVTRGFKAMALLNVVVPTANSSSICPEFSKVK